jgi:hypothetical protein
MTWKQRKPAGVVYAQDLQCQTNLGVCVENLDAWYLLDDASSIRLVFASGRGEMCKFPSPAKAKDFLTRLTEAKAGG